MAFSLFLLPAHCCPVNKNKQGREQQKGADLLREALREKYAATI